MQNVLILVEKTNSYFFDQVDIPHVFIDGIFKNNLIENSLIFKFINKITPIFKFLFYKRSWKSKIKDFTKIIIFDVAYKSDLNILYWIKKWNKNADVFLYYWNIIKDVNKFNIEKKVADKYSCKIYHYDQKDCNTHGLLYNSIMYYSNIKLPLVIKANKYSCIFLGYSKGREEELSMIYQKCHDTGVAARFIIVSGIRRSARYLEIRSKYMPYEEYLTLIAESESILDIAQKGQTGLSLRVMEAIFFDRKLITTNLFIKNELFYNEDNVLIYDESVTAADIKAFLNKPFRLYSQEIKNYYSIEQWIKRFI